MKRLHLLLAVVVVALSACVYEVPVTARHKIPVNPAFLGVWQGVPEEGREPDPNEQALVLKLSGTEYLIAYPAEQDHGYYRAYHVTVGGLSCLQVQLIGSASGPVEEDERKFHLLSYKQEGDVLEIRLLNDNLIDSGIKTSRALRKAILKNIGNPELFKETIRFRRLGETS